MKKFLAKLSAYWDNPPFTGKEISMRYHILKYKLLNLIDPPPKQGEKELTDNYFDRIDPKYGLRFYEMMVNLALNINLEFSLPHVDELKVNKKVKKAMKDLLITVYNKEQENIEKYKKFLIRSEVLKNS
jgi:hypothetical protein